VTYCAKCGSQVEGKFCPKCGASVDAPGGAPGGAPGPTPGYVPGAPPPPAGSQSLGMEENLAAALAYIPIVGLIFLLIEPYKNNKNIRFHSLQSIFYTVACIAVGIALAIVDAILLAALPYSMFHLWLLLTRLVNLAFFIGWILLVVKAYQGQRLVLPVIGPMAEKQA
jgi:uncharacterized membrane protein